MILKTNDFNFWVFFFEFFSPKWGMSIGFRWTSVQIDETRYPEVDFLGPGVKKRPKTTKNRKNKSKKIHNPKN